MPTLVVKERTIVTISVIQIDSDAWLCGYDDDEYWLQLATEQQNNRATEGKGKQSRAVAELKSAKSEINFHVWSGLPTLSCTC